MELTLDILRKCMPGAKDPALEEYLSPLNITFTKFQINTPKRIAAFLAQVGHESGSFRYNKEIYTGEVYDVGAKAKSLGNTPEDDGDGEKYIGRGPMQITGYANYFKLTKELGMAYGVDFTKNPEFLEQPLYGTLSAGWFWNSRGLNIMADQDDLLRISKRINGVNSKTGFPNGWDDRLKRWSVCKKTLGV